MHPWGAGFGIRYGHKTLAYSALRRTVQGQPWAIGSVVLFVRSNRADRHNSLHPSNKMEPILDEEEINRTSNQTDRTSPRPQRNVLSAVKDISAQIHAQVQAALRSLSETTGSDSTPRPPSSLQGYGPNADFIEHLKRVDFFFSGKLVPYPREEVTDTGGAKARRVLNSGLKLLKWVTCALYRRPCGVTSLACRSIDLRRVHMYTLYI
jgi:hypothetical protein